MWNKWKESEFVQRMRDMKISRVIWLSGLVIILTLALVLAITAIANRAGRRRATEEPETTVTQEDKPSGKIIIPDIPEDDRNVIPTLSLPVTGKLLQEFSEDIQVFSKTMQDYRVHLGVDIETEAGARVLAAAKGTVSGIWDDPMLGCCVSISHTGDCKTIYGNLDPALADGITVGAVIAQGQLIGNVGDSALSEIAEEPHLHLEMKVKDGFVDPLDYFSASVRTALMKDTAFEESVEGK